MDRMKTPAEILREMDDLDPFSDPDYAPKVEALRLDYLEARLAEAEQETSRVRPPQPDCADPQCASRAPGAHRDMTGGASA